MLHISIVCGEDSFCYDIDLGKVGATFPKNYIINLRRSVFYLFSAFRIAKVFFLATLEPLGLTKIKLRREGAP